MGGRRGRGPRRRGCRCSRRALFRGIPPLLVPSTRALRGIPPLLHSDHETVQAQPIWLESLTSPRSDSAAETPSGPDRLAGGVPRRPAPCVCVEVTKPLTPAGEPGARPVHAAGVGIGVARSPLLALASRRVRVHALGEFSDERVVALSRAESENRRTSEQFTPCGAHQQPCAAPRFWLHLGSIAARVRLSRRRKVE